MPPSLPFPGRSYATGSIQVDQNTQREQSGYLAIGQTALKFGGRISIASAQTVNLYTVPYNKLLFITDLFWSHDSTVAIRYQLNMVLNGSTITIFDWPVKGDTAPFVAPGIETQPEACPSGALLQLVTGNNASTNAYFWIEAIEQNVGLQ